MLSYQHIYHAGNFADVHKHATLAELLRVLVQRPLRFCVMDTHAGRGLYDLTSPEAQKVGEFRTGILPFWNKREEKSPLSNYLKIVSQFNDTNELKRYPGTAKIAQHIMRPSDNLLLVERHPGEIVELQKCFEGVPNVTIEEKDGFKLLVSKVPFPERVGLVIVDPSYEIKSEYIDLPKLLWKAYKRWPQGQFMIWYPMLPAKLHHQLLTKLRETQIMNMLVSEVRLDNPPQDSFGMYGSGVILINPPFGIETALNPITQHIASQLPMKATGAVLWLNNQRINPETGMLGV